MTSQSYIDFHQNKSSRDMFLGVNVDLYKMEETLDLICESIHAKKKILQSDINVAKFVLMRSNPNLRNAVEASDLISIDGMGIFLGCKMLGIPVEEKVSGVDLMMNLLERCAKEGLRPYFFGAKQEIVETAIENIKARYPDIEIAGYRNGYFSEEDELDIVREINEAKPDCLFVGISTPTKEVFLHKYRDQLDVGYLMGVGGAFDVVAGKVKRAPVWMQKYGLEWFYRFMQEPKRMWKRYLSTNSQYGFILTKALCGKFFFRKNVHVLKPRLNTGNS